MIEFKHKTPIDYGGVLVYSKVIQGATWLRNGYGSPRLCAGDDRWLLKHSITSLTAENDDYAGCESCYAMAA